MKVYIKAGCDASYFSKVCDARVDDTPPEVDGTDVSAIFHKHCKDSSKRREDVDLDYVCFNTVVRENALQCGRGTWGDNDK